jgi:hypothetical protein
MVIEKCPYCGSRNLIIDYWTGSLVCGDCGSVIEENLSEYEINHYKNVKRRIENAIVENRSYKKITVENRIVWRNGKQVHVASYTALNTWKRLRTENPVLERYLRILQEDKEMSSRSIRVKLGLAYALLLYEEKGESVSRALRKACSTFYLSERNLRKLFNYYINHRRTGETGGERIRDTPREGKAHTGPRVQGSPYTY